LNLKLKAPEAIEENKKKEFIPSTEGICPVCGKTWSVDDFYKLLASELPLDEKYLLMEHEKLGIVHELCYDLL